MSATKQTTLTAVAAGRKRALTMSNGQELDYTSSNLPATLEIVEALRLRVIQLEDELASQPPPAKRARTSAASTTVGSSGNSNAVAGPSSGATAAQSKADEKKRKLQIKKIFDSLKKQCKSADVKFQGRPKVIKIDQILEPAEFEAIFSGKGTLIQPTPENKPKSVVTIIKFSQGAQVQELFGDELKALTGFNWTRGGIHFGKAVKLGSCNVDIIDIEVNYSKNNMKCSLKFEVAQEGACGMGDYDSDEY